MFVIKLPVKFLSANVVGMNVYCSFRQPALIHVNVSISLIICGVVIAKFSVPAERDSKVSKFCLAETTHS